MMPLGTSWLRKIVKVTRGFLTSGEAKLLMILMLPSSQAVKNNAFCLITQPRQWSFLILRLLSHSAAPIVHSPLVALSDTDLL